jgi:hypothetical protein
MEIIHIELTDKRGEFSMFEIFGQDLILKQIFILNNEAVSLISPFDNMTILFFLFNFPQIPPGCGKSS